MVIKLKFKSFIAVMLLVSFSSFAAESAIDSKDLAPEATVAEAQTSFWDLPYLKEAFIDTTPADRKDGILVGELGIDGGNKTMILKLAQEIADQKHGKYDSLLISHQGKLLFESYYLRGRLNLPHGQSSGAKSYTSLALGRAMQLGHLTMADLHKPLVFFLKDLDPTKFVRGIEKITLHQALTMRSGLRFSEEQIKEFRGNPSQFNGLAQVQAFLELSTPITQESQVYNYGGFDEMMVMQVLDAVVPGSAGDFIKSEFLNKLGINNYIWGVDLSGLPTEGGDTSFTSRDMLKVGTLLVNKGKWNGEQLISAEYLASATSKISKPNLDWQPDSFNYGYLWYQTDLIVGDKSYATNIAWGGGGQRIIVLEALDLVVVTTGHDREDTIMTQVSTVILPAFVK